MSTSATHPVERAIPPAVMTRIGNPVLTFLLSGRRRSARVGQNLLLLHVPGRLSGRLYSIPVAYHREADGSLLVLTSSAWRVNLRGAPTPVELTLLGRRLPAVATLSEDPDVVAGGGLEAQQAARRLGIRI